MSQLIDNLNIIESVKADIKTAIENKGVDMTGVSFPGYASKIGEISSGGQFITEPLNVTSNGTYTPGQGVDGFSTVTVDVPQSVTGFTGKEVTEGIQIVNLSNSASYVHEAVFKYDTYLQTVNLPNCYIVKREAFGECQNLTTVNLPECKSIGSSAFQGCKNLKTINIPLCSYIGAYAFYIWSYFVSELNLPKCISIGNNAFGRCYSLATVNVPICKNIGNNAFSGCSSLSVAYIGTEISTVCVLGNTGVFQGCSALTSIYVPTSLVESYKTATNWTYYSDKIVGI